MAQNNNLSKNTFNSYLNFFNSILSKSSPSEIDSDSDILLDKKLKKNLSDRDDKVTSLLKQFVDEHERRTESDKTLKKKFLIGLIVSLSIIGGLIIGAVVCVFVFPLAIGNLISLLGIVFTFLGSLLFIVKMLLKYLFPLDLDKNIISLISKIIDHDLNQYKHFRKITKNNEKTDGTYSK